MTNENQHVDAPEKKPAPLGSRLKSAREALGLDHKDAAAQLRLSEKIIAMMEKDKYPTDLPATFIRGYIRAYGKLLQIPENEIINAIEPIKPNTSPPAILPSLKTYDPVTSGNYLMQLFTYLIVITLLGLAGMWWYNHNNASPSENQLSVPDSTSATHNTTTPLPIKDQTPPATVTTTPTANTVPNVNPIAPPAPVATPVVSPSTINKPNVTNSMVPTNNATPTTATPAKAKQNNPSDADMDEANFDDN